MVRTSCGIAPRLSRKASVGGEKNLNKKQTLETCLAMRLAGMNKSYLSNSVS
jgi:hypothetical protein